MRTLLAIATAAFIALAPGIVKADNALGLSLRFSSNHGKLRTMTGTIPTLFMGFEDGDGNRAHVIVGANRLTSIAAMQGGAEAAGPSGTFDLYNGTSKSLRIIIAHDVEDDSRVEMRSDLSVMGTSAKLAQGRLLSSAFMEPGFIELPVGTYDIYIKEYANTLPTIIVRDVMIRQNTNVNLRVDDGEWFDSPELTVP